MDDAFVKPGRSVLAYFGTDDKVGQTEEQVKKSREKYGYNGETFDDDDDDVVFVHNLPTTTRYRL